MCVVYNFNKNISRIVKPRSKSECSPFRSTSGNQANNKQVLRSAVSRDNPKINPCSTSTTVNITYQHLQQQHQSKNKNMPAMHQQQQHQTNSVNVIDYNTNKPPNGRQLTIINTGMHTNEM